MIFATLGNVNVKDKRPWNATTMIKNAGIVMILISRIVYRLNVRNDDHMVKEITSLDLVP
jgi:hypothetical protein